MSIQDAKNSGEDSGHHNEEERTAEGRQEVWCMVPEQEERKKEIEHCDQREALVKARPRWVVAGSAA